MATVTINDSPLHQDAIVTYPYGIYDTSYTCDYHTGIDFAPFGGYETNPDLYSVCTGIVKEVNLTPSASLGNNVVILDTGTGKYWRYCHMVTGSVVVSVNQNVTTASKIGKMRSNWKGNWYTFTPRIC